MRTIEKLINGRCSGKRGTGNSRILRITIALVGLVTLSVCRTVPPEEEPQIMRDFEKGSASTHSDPNTENRPVPPASSESLESRPPGPAPPSIAQREKRAPRARVRPLTEDQKAILESAFRLYGMPPESTVVVNGRTFVLDCIGTVSAIFYALGIDITKDFNRYSGNGVGRLYKSLRDRGTLHEDRFPKPGDVVFWNNTWDRNGDGDLRNDPTTHAGIVLHVDDDGTIYYVHEHVREGVIVEVMNLYHPTVYRNEYGKQWNNAMALGSYFGNPDNPRHWLSGDLWYLFGGVLPVKEHFRAVP